MIEILHKIKKQLKNCIKATEDNINNIRQSMSKGKTGPTAIMIIKILEQEYIKYKKILKEIEENIIEIEDKQERLNKSFKYKIAKFLGIV